MHSLLSLQRVLCFSLFFAVVCSVSHAPHTQPRISALGREYVPGAGDRTLWSLVRAKLTENEHASDANIARQLSIYPSTVRKIRLASADGQVGPQPTGKLSASYRYVVE